MTDPEPDTENTDTKNTAEGGATVGIQASSVHNSNVYIVQPDASPEDTYKAGVQYLDAGVPGRARELIEEAIAHDHDNGEVRFHWVLAVLSKRAYRDLNAQDRAQLAGLPDLLPRYSDDEWKRALGALCGLLKHLQTQDSDPGPALDELESLPKQQHTMIVRHLDLVLTGSLKHRLWTKSCQAAEQGQCHKDRLNRAWAYFHPDPAKARALAPDDDTITYGTWFRALAWTAVFVTVFGRLSWSALADETLLLAILGTLVSGYSSAVTGLEWHYRTTQLNALEGAYSNKNRTHRVPRTGFSRLVDRSFQYYAHKYAPEGEARERWLTETAGIRDSLRDEIIELYRDGKYKIEQINWLIYYLVMKVRDRWRKKTLHDYRHQYRVSLATKIWCLLSFAVLVVSTLNVILAALRTDLLPSALAIPMALASGWGTSANWLRILSNHRRVRDAEHVYEQTKHERDVEYEKWKKKLSGIRPTESEMETWLDCDKTLFLRDAMRNYQLTWSDVIAHTFLQAPAQRYKRARAEKGPWRYSKYDLRLFLITHEGVREVGTELDFRKAIYNGQERTNFRFDAVSSIRVTINGESSYSLELTLTNGPARSIRIIDAAPDAPEKPADLSKLNLDAAGFTHTLHILEGIAAEGKQWINPDPIPKVTISPEQNSHQREIVAFAPDMRPNHPAAPGT